jgi:hypothetical protein
MCNRDTASISDAPELTSTRFREGFYAIHYEGPAGKGVLLTCLKGERLVGADMGGGLLEGSYRLVNEDLVAECVFHFSAGRLLVTGQTLTDDVLQRKKLSIPMRMFEGERCAVDIGFGRVDARGVFVAGPP